MTIAGTSRVIGSPPGAVWDCVGDFGGWDRWLPRIVSSELRGGSGRAPVGAVRFLVLDDGSQVGERLLACDERHRRLVYGFDGVSPFPVSRYEATVQVHSVAQGGSSFVTWTGDFDATGEAAASLSGTFVGIYERFLDALAGHLV